MPRSGTTLTERVLGAHPDVYPSGELRNVPNMASQIEPFPAAVRNLSPMELQNFGANVYASMFANADSESFVIDKLPGNYQNVGFIATILPNAKFIYCKRDPIDNCVSCYEQHFEDGLNYSFSLEGLAEAYKQHEKIMEHWFEVCPIPIHTVKYEELVSEPERIIRGLLDYVGIEWNDACLNPEEAEGSIITASVWQARQPINMGSVERWRRYESQIQPLIKALEAP